MKTKTLPFYRLIAFIFIFIFFLMADSLLEGMLVVLTIFVALKFFGVDAGKAIRPLLRLYVFYITVFLFNALFQHGETVYWHWWIFTLTREGIIRGLEVVLRVFIVSILANILTLSMSALDLSDALATLFYPLRFLHVPVDEGSFIISEAFSFIPSLSQDANHVMKAMKSRGVSGRAKLSRMVLPLSIAAFRRADDMSNALISRGYDGGGRKRKSETRPGVGDLAIMIFAILLFTKGVY